MDHILLPMNASIPAWDVPFVCKSGYALNVGPFHEFPGRYLQSLGSSSTELLLGPAEVLLPLIQAWLFFGSMSEFFQTEIDVQKFSKVGTSRPHLICTFELTHLREQWMQFRNLTAEDKPRTSLKKELAVLIQASYACEQLEKANIDIPGLEPILLSIRILLCSLAITAKSVVKNSSDIDHLLQRLSLRPFRCLDAPIRTFPFLQHMVKNGWW